MKIFTIPITKEDIANGVQDSTNKCMVARAIKKTYGATHIYINDGICRFNYNGIRYFCSPTGEMKEKIAKFDEDKSLIEPFTLRLRVEGTGLIAIKDTFEVIKSNSDIKRPKAKNKFKNCKTRRFTSGSYNKKLKQAA